MKTFCQGLAKNFKKLKKPIAKCGKSVVKPINVFVKKTRLIVPIMVFVKYGEAVNKNFRTNKYGKKDKK